MTTTQSTTQIALATTNTLPRFLRPCAPAPPPAPAGGTPPPPVAPPEAAEAAGLPRRQGQHAPWLGRRADGDGPEGRQAALLVQQPPVGRQPLCLRGAGAPGRAGVGWSWRCDEAPPACRGAAGRFPPPPCAPWRVPTAPRARAAVPPPARFALTGVRSGPVQAYRLSLPPARSLSALQSGCEVTG